MTTTTGAIWRAIGRAPSCGTWIRQRLRYAITVPTLVIVGSGDLSVVRATADDLTAGIPGARKVVMEGLAHVPNMDEPEEFNRIILEFLLPVWQMRICGSLRRFEYHSALTSGRLGA